MGDKIWTPSMMGKKGGKKSVQSRFKGKTKDEISDMMRRVRYSKKDSEYGNAIAARMVSSLHGEETRA